jgi:hypothetical protein
MKCPGQLSAGSAGRRPSVTIFSSLENASVTAILTAMSISTRTFLRDFPAYR